MSGVTFPGVLGVALYRLRSWMRDSPIAAVGPLLGFIAADISVDLARGRLTNVGIDLVIAPLLALLVTFVAQRGNPGISGLLLLALGGISVLGASTLLVLGIGHGAAPVVVIGLRHLAVAAYAWAAIAEEPPVQQQRFTFRPVHG